LTNVCYQSKDQENFAKHEEGNTVSFQEFQDYLTDEYPDLDVSIEKHIWPRMRDIAIDSILSAKGNINTKQRRFGFELLGFDFLIDEDFRTWLLEVNNNPYLGY
jgi:hypothetical protein